MSYYVDRDLRLAREKEYGYMFDAIRKTKVLDQYPQIFRLSAAIGYYKDPTSPGEEVKNSGEKVMLNFFNEIDYNYIDILAFKITGKQIIVKKEGEVPIFGSKYTIFEKYVKKGLPILYNYLNLDKEKLFYTDEESYEVALKIINLLLNPSACL